MLHRAGFEVRHVEGLREHYPLTLRAWQAISGGRGSGKLLDRPQSAGYRPAVPVEFLTDEQAEAYGTFAEEPTRPELERFFFLDDEDRKLIAKRRGDHSRLGFALQMCTVRYIGLFLEDPLAVPWPIVEYLADQLGIGDVSSVKRYTERQMTVYEHAW